LGYNAARAKIRQGQEGFQPNMHALVTGISGFGTSSLTDLLISNGWEISGFDQRESGKIRQTQIGNILDQTALAEALRISKPEVVFHLAGAIKAKLAKDYL
jgi:nucleoside-diphosphate-sugar epimerase